MVELKPIVTIGVCVRNCASTIHDAINSIIAQDYPHELMQLVIVDGYSEDGTVSIIEECLKNTDIKTRIFRENKGLGYARQIVVDDAEGQYIVWVDGDMILPKDFARKQVKFMEQNPKVGIAKGRYGLNNQNSLVAILENMEFATAFEKVGDYTPTSLGTSGCIYRIEAIRQIGGFDANIKGVGEDMDVEHRVKAAGWKLCISPAYFYERRRKTWRALWEEYSWHGKGGFHIYRKNKKIVIACKMFPLAVLFKKLIQTTHAYKLTHNKKAFLLPLHYIFKRTAWFFGFLTGYIQWCRHKIISS